MLEPASVALTDRVVQDNIYGMPDAPRVQDRSDVASDLFNRTFSLMAPGIDKANERLINNLQGRGIPLGSEAFNESYGEQTRNTQDTIARLAMDSNINAGQEQTRQFGLDQAARSTAIAELVAAMGGGYNPPNSVPSGAGANINYGGMVSDQYNQQMQQYNQQRQNSMGVASTLGSIGGALLKSSVHAKHVEGFADMNVSAAIIQQMPIYAWKYLEDQAPSNDHGGVHVGPMAEHFQHLTGLGRSDFIDVIDYLGVVTSALQNALNRIDMLERMALEDDGLVKPQYQTRLN